MIINLVRMALFFGALLSICPGGIQAQAWSSSPRDMYSLTLEEVALSALEGAFQDQVMDSKDPVYLPGEFRTKIQSTLVPVLVGVGRGFGYDDEATAFARSLIMWKSKAFTQSVISSLLLKVHKLYPEYKVQNYVKLSFY